jgi:hypothetical protein
MEYKVMKANLINIVLLIGALCLLVDAIAIFLGYFGTPLVSAISVLGIILIGAGALGKRLTTG